MHPPQIPVGEWPEYYAATINKPLHPLYDVLDPYLPATGNALELGCGVGHGVLHLAEKGLQVVALDLQPEALEILRGRIPEALRGRISFVQSALEDAELPPSKFDVVVAGFCLFFLEPGAFARAWENIRRAVRPRGLFMGQFLGPNDDWASRPYSIHDKEEVEGLFEGWEILHFEEVDRDGATSVGTSKHWHVFHVVARRMDA